ncbi:MAG: SurA N-terminal domain-containing protein [Desulfobacterota bacterium]|nr:SurA N-terminal domain-containing protein [Thermodesulfobacteriota bacterium]
MLTYLRKHSKGWLAYTAFGAIIVVFILWGGSSYLSREANKVAKIDRTIISMEQYSKAYTDALKGYQAQFGQALTPEMIERLDLRTKVLDQIIDQYVIETDAKGMGIELTDSDLQLFISQVPAFQRDGRFDETVYRKYLEYERLTPPEFEQKARKDLLKQLFVAVITENVIVSQQEFEAAFHQVSDTYDLSYITLDAATFSKDVQVGQDQIQTFYDANKERYRIPPKITIAAIDFPAAAYVASAEVTTDDAMDYYGGHKAEFSDPAKVHMRHILIKVPDGVDAQVVAQKDELAKNIMGQANAGKDFASLAAQYSEDAMTSGKGGDMGTLPLNSFHQELGRIIESMKPGEIKGPIRTPEGIQILKLESKEEAKAIPFEDVSAAVMDKLRLQRAKIIAHDEAKKAFVELYEQAELDFEGYAKAKSLEVRRIGPFSEGENAGMTMTPEAVKKAFTFSAGELGEAVDTSGGYAVYKVISKETSRIPDLKEIADRVSIDVKDQAAVEKAKEYARKLAASTPEKLIAMNPASTGEFTRSAYAVPKLSMIPKLTDELDSLNTPKVFENKGAVFVVWIKSKKTADIRSLDKKQAEDLKNGLLARKRELALHDYLLRARDEKKGWHKVVIEKDKMAEGRSKSQDVPAPSDFN